MSLTPEDASPGGAYYQQAVLELQQPYPDYTKIQALAILSLAGALWEVAEIGRQITVASTRICPPTETPDP
jgi:hypothetical protein